MFVIRTYSIRRGGGRQKRTIEEFEQEVEWGDSVIRPYFGRSKERVHQGSLQKKKKFGRGFPEEDMENALTFSIPPWITSLRQKHKRKITPNEYDGRGVRHRRKSM